MSMAQLHVIKIGGKLINDAVELDRFLTTFAQLNGPKILIHGGGRKASELSRKLGLRLRLSMADASQIETHSM